MSKTIQPATARRHRFERNLGLVLLALFAAFYLWQTPGLVQGRLAAPEIDAYLARIEASPAVPEALRGPLVAQLRSWALQDDGQPVYMINLLRYHDTLLTYPGAPDFKGTPRQANAYYESKVTALALLAGDFPIYAGVSQGPALLEGKADGGRFDRVIVMRYPSRRHALALFSSPDYLPYAPYKLAALQVTLLPTSAELVLSDLRVLCGALLLIVFLLVCWLRSLRRERAVAR